MKLLQRRWKAVLLSILLFLNIVIWVAVISVRPRPYISISFLDIGQGDAALIQGKNGNKIMIDGGPNAIVLERLSESLPAFTHSLDMLIETHPDSDHIGGFPSVLEHYHVGAFMEPGVESPNSVDNNIRAIRKQKGVPDILARTGMVLDFHDGSYLRILFPDRDPTGWETNTASIVAQYVYGNTCFLMTGDSPLKIENYLVSIFGTQLHCQVLKAGHHGSKTSTGDPYLSAVMPEYAVISAGLNNKYGFPHPETLARLADHNVKVISTIDLGTITMHSDGTNISIIPQKGSIAQSIEKNK